MDCDQHSKWGEALNQNMHATNGVGKTRNFRARIRVTDFMCCVVNQRYRPKFTTPRFKVAKSKLFWIQAFVVWLVLCLPGNIFTLVLYQNTDGTEVQVNELSSLSLTNKHVESVEWVP